MGDRLAVEVHVRPEDLVAALRDDARRGLTRSPKELPPKWFYDERGSQLFDEITRLREYYPTRREREILRREAGAIASLARPDTLIELGSGTSEKTRLLLDALSGAGTLQRFVPFDVSEATLLAASRAVARAYPQLTVHAVVGDFEHHVSLLPAGGRRMVAFLGGTIGNLTPPERAKFLAELAAGLGPGDSFLLGADLVKDVARLELAYDDPTGVTADFNRNVLHVLNRELDADFVPERFAHVARWDREEEWIAMFLRSSVSHSVRLGALGLTVPFSAGEELRTEVSAKFHRPGLESELAAAGLSMARWWTDEAGDFSLCLSFPA